MLPVLGAFVCLVGCGGPGLVFNPNPDMTPEYMLDRATLVFVGVVERHIYESWPGFQAYRPVDEEDRARLGYWRVLRRQVRVEFVIRGSERRRVVPVYEISWIGGTTGDWNSTGDGERALFLVREENGRLHVVRDWNRSIFPVTTGRKTWLPLDDSRPFWERVALMNLSAEPNSDPNAMRIGFSGHQDPAQALSRWRSTKLFRGLLRHPSAGLRVSACLELLREGFAQDECWETLTEHERAHIRDHGSVCCTSADIASKRERDRARGAAYWWRSYSSKDERRLMTSTSIVEMRAEFCRLWAQTYPDDHDNGCPADKPPPATIVTAEGDVPLTGPWPVP